MQVQQVLPYSILQSRVERPELPAHRDQKERQEPPARKVRKERPELLDRKDHGPAGSDANVQSITTSDIDALSS